MQAAENQIKITYSQIKIMDNYCFNWRDKCKFYCIELTNRNFGRQCKSYNKFLVIRNTFSKTYSIYMVNVVVVVVFCLFLCFTVSFAYW